MISYFNKSLVLVIAAAIPVSMAVAQDTKADRTLAVNQVLPADMITGQHYRIVDPVVNYAGLDGFTIESDYGTYEAYGQLMLRIRLREIMALAALSELTGKAASTGGAGEQGKKQVKTVANIGLHPVKSAGSIGRGVLNRFKKMGRNIADDVALVRSDLSSKEKSAIYASRWLGVDEARLRWAGKLNIDPYTSNEQLQAELDRVAKADATGKFGVKFLIPTIPTDSPISSVHGLVTKYELRQLISYNSKQLKKLGANKSDIEYFLSMEQYNPTSATIMVELLYGFKDVSNSLALFQQAMTVASDIEALFFIESTLMALWYHQEQSKLTQMLLETGIPAGTTRDGRVVVFAAVDFPHWSDELAAVVTDLQSAYGNVSPNRELLLAGQGSGTFTTQVRKLGWTMKTDIRTAYLPSFAWAITDEQLQKEK